MGLKTRCYVIVSLVLKRVQLLFMAKTSVASALHKFFHQWEIWINVNTNHSASGLDSDMWWTWAINVNIPCLKKNSQNCFSHNFVKFPPTLIILA